MYKLKVIKPDGTEIPIVVEKQPSLEDLIQLVGGWIERYKVSFGGKEVDMLMDEEGRLKKLPINYRATGIAGFTVVGNVILFEEGRFK